MSATLSRDVEVAQLATAIVRTAAKIDRVRQELSNLESRLAAQQAEYRYQKLVLRAYARTAPKEGGA